MADDGASKPEQKNAPKLSFSMASSSKMKITRPAPIIEEEDDQKPEYVSEFDPSKPSASKKAKVIAKLDNTWRPELKMKNIHPHSTDTGLQFVTEEEQSQTDKKVEYGLNLRNPKHNNIPSDDKSKRRVSENQNPEKGNKIDSENLTEIPRVSRDKISENVKNSENYDHNSGKNERISENGKKSGRFDHLSKNFDNSSGRFDNKSVSESVYGDNDRDRVFKEEILSLPDAAGLDEYENVPVEEFGMALLRGMGWNESEGVGKCRKVVEPIAYVPRDGKVGLGAVPALKPEKESKRIKRPGEEVREKRDLVAAAGENGRVRHVVGIGEKLVERAKKGPAVGKVVRIVDGKHSGLKGKVLKMEEREDRDAKVLLRLVQSEEDVLVDGRDLADLGSFEEEQFLKRYRERKQDRNDDAHKKELKYDKIRDRDEDYKKGKENDDIHRRDSRDKKPDNSSGKYDSRDEKHDRRDSREKQLYNSRGKYDSRDEKHDRRDRKQGVSEHKERKYESGSGKSDKRKQDKEEGELDDNEDLGSARPASSWLRSHIRVRVVSKEFKRGKLYLKKGRIIDVVNPTTCDLVMDDGGLVVQGVKQDILETALPKKGGLVLVVFGKHKGVLGKLLERDLDSGVGLVQQEDTYDMLKLPLDDIAEFVGDPSELGY